MIRFVARQSNRKGQLAAWWGCLILIGVVKAKTAWADPRQLTALDSALHGAPGEVAACVDDVTDGSVVYSHHADTALKPASVQKLITTGAVFSRFGPESHFATELYVVGQHGKRVDKLYIRGLGDPSLTTEGLWMLARSVRAHGIFEVGQLFYDVSFFDGGKAREGQRAYLGGTSALAFNYNSVAVSACPTQPGKPAVLTVEPFEVGFAVEGTVRTVAHGESSGDVEERSGKESVRYHVSGQVSTGSGCLQVYRSISDPAYVAAELFRRNLAYLGLHVPASVAAAVVPDHTELLEHAASKPLHEIVWGMNHWSTNVIAEQLVMTLGWPTARSLDLAPLGTQLRREEAIDALEAYAKSVAPKGGSIRIIDGSGLSHENRVSPALLCGVLVSMQRNRNLSVEFENSLAASGRSGTLKDRDFGLPPGVLRGKTGTIDGVSSLAGYLVTPRGNKYAFAIIQNSSLSKGEAVRYEDRFVRALYNDGDK